MKDHSRYVRWDALEEAAKLCESLACTDDHDSTITRLECADKLSLKMKTNEKTLMEKVPLMRCSNKTEFKQRLQWLSEGMLKNHLEHIVNYKINQAEIEEYKKFKGNI